MPIYVKLNASSIYITRYGYLNTCGGEEGAAIVLYFIQYSVGNSVSYINLFNKYTRSYQSPLKSGKKFPLKMGVTKIFWRLSTKTPRDMATRSKITFSSRG